VALDTNNGESHFGNTEVRNAQISRVSRSEVDLDHRSYGDSWQLIQGLARSGFRSFGREKKKTS
jgi:hypothetical protein